MRIGIFDSGIGGLTVLKELINKNIHYIYIGDSLNMPYGNKSKTELMQYAKNILNYFVQRNVDLVIIACGTISSTIYKELQKMYKIKILDIISPTISFIKNSNYTNILVMATPNTIDSNIFASQLKNKNIYSCPCPLLAKMIETNDLELKAYLDSLLQKYQNKTIDILIYGCTHYPLLDNYIKNKYGYLTLNMAKPILNKINNSTELKVEVFFTKLDSTIKNNVKNILGNDYTIKKLKL